MTRGLSPERSQKHLFYSEVVQHADSVYLNHHHSLFVPALDGANGDDASGGDPNGDDNHGELPATDISHCIDAQIGPSFRSQLANYWNRSITDANTLNEKKNVILNVKISAGKKIFPHNFPNLE